MPKYGGIAFTSYTCGYVFHLSDEDTLRAVVLLRHLNLGLTYRKNTIIISKSIDKAEEAKTILRDSGLV
jgi:hypothetical protein